MSKLVNYDEDAVITYGPDDTDYDYQQTPKTEE